MKDIEAKAKKIKAGVEQMWSQDAATRDNDVAKHLYWAANMILELVEDIKHLRKKLNR